MSITIVTHTHTHSKSYCRESFAPSPTIYRHMRNPRLTVWPCRRHHRYRCPHRIRHHRHHLQHRRTTINQSHSHRRHPATEMQSATAHLLTIRPPHRDFYWPDKHCIHTSRTIIWFIISIAHTAGHIMNCQGKAPAISSVQKKYNHNHCRLFC